MSLVLSLHPIMNLVSPQDLSGKKYCPLHYAAVNGNAEVASALLKKGANPNAKDGEFSRTPLHLLTNKWKTNEDAYKECLDTLLDHTKIRVDVLDQSSYSPLFLAASKGWEYMVRRLVLKGANLKAASGKKTVEDVIRKKFPDLLDSIDLAAIVKPKRHFSDELYDALTNSDLEVFREILDEIQEDEQQSLKSALEEDHGEYTLLQYACENGLADFVEELLKRGADPSHADQTSQMSPVLYAARNGYYKILELLLLALRDQKLEKTGLKQRDRRKETALHKVVKREYVNKSEAVDYFKCLQLLIDKKRSLDLDAQDEFGCTALHYAVLCDDQSFVRVLLLNGAHLGIRNQFGTLAITRIQPSVLEEVLNDCIKYKNNMSDREFEIILHYSMLAPSQKSQQPETECLRFLSGSRKHRRLLRHPVIDTFLFLKWQRIQKYYYFNIVLYAIFLTLLTAYILIFHGTFTPLPDPADSAPQNATDADTGISDSMKDNEFLRVSLLVFIFICTLYLLVREGIQFYVSWKLYVMRLENWLEISIILLTCTVLFIPMEVVAQQSVCAWLVLLSWIEMLLLLGRHPYLSIYITMFTTVTNNFFKFIAMFSLMVVAFSISFYLVFQVDEHFATYYQSLLKTVAMTTGEIEYTDLPLDAFPGSSHLLFVVFVFLIVLVLMNLLNGLAVSDIQQIQQEAELVSYSSRVELVSYIESVFLASPLHHIFPRSLRCCEGGEEKEDCSFTTCLEQHNPAMQLLNRLGRRTLMFQTCLRQNPSISVFPNRGKDRWYVCECHRFQLKEAQIEAAKDVVLEKEHAVSTHRLSGLEARMDQLMEAVSSLAQKVNDHILMPPPQ